MSLDQRRDDDGSALRAVEEVVGSEGIFAGLDPDTRAAIETEVRWVHVPGGENLFRQGDAGDALYVLITGRLRVMLERPGDGDRLLAEIGRGEVVGEMALLTGDPRSATVRAVRDSELVEFSRDAFNRVVEKNPHALLQITRRLITRLQQMNRAAAVATLRTVAVVPIGPAAPVADFAARLATALGRFGSVLHLKKDHKHLMGGLPEGEWLDAQERAYAYVVYEADQADPVWTDRSIRQADQILLIADADADAPDEAGRSAPSSVRQTIGRSEARKDLVLAHQKPSASGTERWLKAWAVAHHHHVQQGSQPDVDRIARLLTGRGIGLVLGGGGARGFAHLGVIRALHEAGIAIDAVAGTSMGAVIAAQYAMGLDLDAMIAANRRGWIDADPLRDKTLPVVALLSCYKLDRMLADMYRDLTIEDLWIKFFCISTNLTEAKEVVHERGSLRRAVRASMSLPGIAIPVWEEGGGLLIDGGVLNNLPADVMRRFCGGGVVAVDVTPEKDLSMATAHQEARSGWSLMWDKPPAKLPSILAIIMRTVMLGSASRRALVQKDVDLYLDPPIERFGMFEWGSIEALAEAGYTFSRPEIAKWMASRAPAAAPAAPAVLV